MCLILAHEAGERVGIQRAKTLTWRRVREFRVKTPALR